MLKKVVLFAVILAFAFAIASPATAEDSASQDLGVSNPVLLPDSPFYFLKEWRRGLAITFTFNKVRKAELKNIFANERLVELQKLAKKSEVNADVLQKAADKYKQASENLKTAVDGIKQEAENNANVKKFIDKFARHQELQQEILQKLEAQVPEKALEKIKEARQAHLEKFKDVMEKAQGKKLCTMEYAPVCGTDGKTYGNKCVAESSGIASYTNGECEKGNECSEDANCCAEIEISSGKPGLCYGKCVDGRCKRLCQADTDCPVIYCIKAPCPQQKCVEGACKMTEEEDEEETETGCKNLWWYDNENRTCQQKEFCGAYMYLGLYTFEQKEACQAQLSAPSN